MNETLHVYCDESCHLEHDGKPVVVLGAVVSEWIARRMTCQP